MVSAAVKQKMERGQAHEGNMVVPVSGPGGIHSMQHTALSLLQAPHGASLVSLKT